MPDTTMTLTVPDGEGGTITTGPFTQKDLDRAADAIRKRRDLCLVGHARAGPHPARACHDPPRGMALAAASPRNPRHVRGRGLILSIERTTHGE